MNTPFLSIVIPVYNEEGRILPTLQRVAVYLEGQPYSWQVVVADDGSADATASQVREFAASHPQVSHLPLPHRGKGGAVQAGMLHAQGEYRFLCDADLSMPIEQLERFLPPGLSEFDVAVGSREAPGARRLQEPAFRHTLSRVFALWVRLAAVSGIQDTQCGFKCFRAQAAQALFSRQRLWGFSFDVEVLFLARRLGLRLVEVPIDWYHDSASKVHPLRDGLAMALDVPRVRWNAWRGKYGVLRPPMAGTAGEGSGRASS